MNIWWLVYEKLSDRQLVRLYVSEHDMATWNVRENANTKAVDRLMSTVVKCVASRKYRSSSKKKEITREILLAFQLQVHLTRRKNKILKYIYDENVEKN